MIKAREAYARWVNDKNAERKRINEEKRLEQAEVEVDRCRSSSSHSLSLLQARQANDEQRLDQLRREKYRQWIDRKNYQAMIDTEFKKLQAGEEEFASDGSSTSSHHTNRAANHRAFHK